jgi:hypothetical protein
MPRSTRDRPLVIGQSKHDMIRNKGYGKDDERSDIQINPSQLQYAGSRR